MRLQLSKGQITPGPKQHWLTAKEMAQGLGIEEVEGKSRIPGYPVPVTPRLVVNEQVVWSGRLPARAEVTTFTANALAPEDSSRRSEQRIEVSLLPKRTVPER